METPALEYHCFTTSDGVRLRYLEAGRGRPLVLLHGWSQTAAMFRYQIEALSPLFRVIAPDMRGHGQSDKPAHGYRVSRLATDLRELISGLGLSRVNLAGHSMGCAVAWCYWDLFGGRDLARLVFMDQEPIMLANPAWSEPERKVAGASLGQARLFEFCNQLAGPGCDQARAEFIGGRFTAAASPEMVQWVLSENRQMPAAFAARLLFDHAGNDWRDVMPRITAPCLVITGEASNKPLESQQWICRQIPDCRLEVFGAEEGGQHFMFLENPAKTNRLLAGFFGE